MLINLNPEVSLLKQKRKQNLQNLGLWRMAELDTVSSKEGQYQNFQSLHEHIRQQGNCLSPNTPLVTNITALLKVFLTPKTLSDMW
jgi:hypothetical protein